MARRPRTPRVGTDPPKHPPVATPWLPRYYLGVVRGGPGGRKTGDPKRASGAKNAGMRARRRPKGGAVSAGGRGGGPGPGPPDPLGWAPAGYCATTWKCQAARPGGWKTKRASVLGPGSEPQSSKHETGPLGTGIGKRVRGQGERSDPKSSYRGVGGPPPPKTYTHGWLYDWRPCRGEKKFHGRAPNPSRRSAARSTLCPKTF